MSGLGFPAAKSSMVNERRDGPSLACSSTVDAMNAGQKSVRRLVAGKGNSDQWGRDRKAS